MKKYLLSETGRFYKANLHCHTTLSDGARTPEEIKEIYKQKGYAIVAYTDHDILIPHDELTDDGFLALHGFEMEINDPTGLSRTCHMCLIALEPDNVVQPFWHRSAYLFGNAPKHRDEVRFDETEPDFVREYTGECISKIMETAREKGFFVTYNHPTWSRESYPQYIRYRGMHAMELFNGGCIAAGYDDYNPRVYEDFLNAGYKLYCIGSDDNHNHHPENSREFDSGWAFTMIKAESLAYRDVTRALENGQFYASEGPEIYELWVEDGNLHIRCSDADRINITFQSIAAATVLSENGVPVNEAEFRLDPALGYFRLTVVDSRGRRACTNAYFPEDLL